MNKFLNFTLKIIYIFIFCLIIFFAFNIYNSKYAFYLDIDDFSMILGDKYTIDITPRYYQYFDINNYIIEDDSGIIEIDGNDISAVNEGTTIITVRSKERYNVKKIKLSVISTNITSIDVDESIVLGFDEEKSLDVALNGETIKSNFKYEVENPNIATIDENGNITPVGEGNTQVKISYSDDIYTYTNITVTTEENKKNIETNPGPVTDTSEGPVNIDVSSVKLDKKSISLYPNDVDSLEAIINPSNASDKSVTWSSSNTNIVSVDNGNIHANNIGTATITVTTANGKKATCTVSVIGRPIDVESIALQQSSLTLANGNSITLGYTISPSDASNKNVTWTSSNTSVATVSNGVVKAKKVGTAIITVTTNNGKTATCNVEVKKGVVNATSISLNTSSLNIDVGNTSLVTATVLPEDTTNKIVSWSSSNSSVATVDQNGFISGIRQGSATITAKTVNGKTATVSVNVIKPNIRVESVSLNAGNISLYIGGTSSLVATVNPSNANNKNVTWSSSNTGVATVSNGVITAKGVGTTVITATADGKQASCTVNVTKKVVDLIRGSIYNNGFLNYYEGYYGNDANNGKEAFEYSLNSNNCNSVNHSDTWSQYYTLYPTNNKPVFQECHYEGNTKVYSATIDGNNDKLVKVTPNNEVQLDIATYGKEYSPYHNTWPHLLITGRTGVNGLGDWFFNDQNITKIGLTPSDRSYYYFSSDNQMDLSVDVKLNSFNKGNAINGIHAFQYLLFLEVYCDTACGNEKIGYWFGFNLFDDRGVCYEVDQGDVRLDEKTGMLTVLLPSKQVFTNGTIYNGGNFVYNQWKNVRVNLSSMVDQLVNQIHLSGKPNVKASDLRYGGFNIGYEVHGEYWVSMSFKNLRLTSTKR